MQIGKNFWWVNKKCNWTSKKHWWRIYEFRIFQRS